MLTNQGAHALNGNMAKRSTTEDKAPVCVYCGRTMNGNLQLVERHKNVVVPLSVTHVELEVDYVLVCNRRVWVKNVAVQPCMLKNLEENRTNWRQSRGRQYYHRRFTELACCAVDTPTEVLEIIVGKMVMLQTWNKL